CFFSIFGSRNLFLHRTAKPCNPRFHFSDFMHFSEPPRQTNKKRLETEVSSLFGGDKRDRTADLLNAIQALSQLSYTPIFTWHQSGRPNELYFSTGHPLCQLFFSFFSKFFSSRIRARHDGAPGFSLFFRCLVLRGLIRLGRSGGLLLAAPQGNGLGLLLRLVLLLFPPLGLGVLVGQSRVPALQNGYHLGAGNGL